MWDETSKDCHSKLNNTLMGACKGQSMMMILKIYLKIIVMVKFPNITSLKLIYIGLINMISILKNYTLWLV